MVLKVDLQCRRCYKKVKQVLCKFPQIQDQIYDEKANTVTIKVVCCDPEKMRGKIRCKGGDSIESIEIKPPPKSEKPKPETKPPDPEGPPNKPAKKASPPDGFCCTVCYHGHHGGPCYFGGPPPPPYYWPYGRPVYVNWGGGGGSTYCYCFEENPQCSVM
ncbi:hypothetical protein Gogos_008257 [Gossypium gossypioides]|uniref:HMA domain-containing protein n=1 Tax=Gossypium gossypioides TaxID=34282 RepID=A0A7J9CBB7_GOSGO|nr:hypothetical protein [Gossypium gossypioides]